MKKPWVRCKMHRFMAAKFLLLFLLLCMIIDTATVEAAPPIPNKDITPSHVFQASRHALAELLPLIEARRITPNVRKTSMAERMPRHVWQKAREVLIKIQYLQAREGIPPLALPPSYTGDIAPSDVKILVDAAFDALRTIREKEGLSQPDYARFQAGKTPTDVYQNLSILSLLLDTILKTSITPSDVYRVAQSVNDVLHQIYEIKGLTAPNANASNISGKSPRDVYRLSLELMRKLDRLTRTPGYAIPGGVVILQPIAGRITPSDVINAQESILADVQAMGLSIMGVKPIEIPHFETGKIPSDVYRLCLEAITLVEGLQ
ncbi:hypothetical protein [Kordiimonas pumila]|nr:hypothetical protein [Kordiimonas pumila]